ncbi:hypothetical protein C5Y96_11035 [Blastopirellula marina]|uniref:Toxin-antitoxin system YwqK family antitoxin n=2 Tax=Pirellulales TaxID=2691354 RepID=A0A2S8FMI3_9BACT|nr:hypothetical protein C5Y96_11035 [Blastopirellula marina]RCS52464.1 hypothetical protein DTL36_11045 [Bremerella cremea]
MKATIVEQELAFPDTIQFAGKKWKLHQKSPGVNVLGKSYDYVADRPNELLRVFKGGRRSEILESFVIYNRSDLHAQWVENGKTVVTDSSGRTVEWTMLNGVREGRFRQFYVNGEVKHEGICVNGVIGGESKGFYPDGSLWWEGSLDNGMLFGSNGLFYREDGTPIYNLTSKEKLREYEEWRASDGELSK